MQHELRLTVGEAARTVGVSAKAIRLWEAKGLVSALERTEAGYRLFTRSDLAVLRYIRQAKALGLTLGEIKDILDLQHAGTEPCERVCQMIDAHIAKIDRTLDDLRQVRQSLAATRSNANKRRWDRTAATVCRIIESHDASEPCLPIMGDRTERPATRRQKASSSSAPVM